MQYERLDYVNGDFILLFETDIPLKLHGKVKGYLDQLKLAIAQEPLRIDELEDFSEYLFHKYYIYYAKLYEILNIPYNNEDIDPVSNFTFLIGSIRGEQLGLSRLEKLMGYKEASDETSEDSSEAPPFTTGDILLDIETDLRLTFKHNAEGLIESRSLNQCCLMLKQASDRISQAHSEMDEKYGINKEEKELSLNKKVKTLKQHELPQESESFQSDKDDIRRSLESNNIKLPEGF